MAWNQTLGPRAWIRIKNSLKQRFPDPISGIGRLKMARGILWTPWSEHWALEPIFEKKLLRVHPPSPIQRGAGAVKWLEAFPAQPSTHQLVIEHWACGPDWAYGPEHWAYGPWRPRPDSGAESSMLDRRACGPDWACGPARELTRPELSTRFCQPLCQPFVNPFVNPAPTRAFTRACGRSPELEKPFIRLRN